MAYLKILFLSVLFFSLRTSAQTDSAAYYRQELYKLTRRVNDSLRTSEEYMRLQEAIKRFDRNEGYVGIVLAGGLIRSDYTAFNRQIANSGFPSMDPMAGKISFGMSGKNDRTVFDFYFFSFSDGSKSKKGNDRIVASVVNAFLIDVGYTLVNTKRFAFYPYYGISIRVAELDYETPVQLNAGFTDISNFIQNNREIQSSSFRLGYQAGLGMDLVLFENKKHTTNKVIFVKGGVSRPIGKDRYKAHGTTINSDIRHGIWDLNFGIKFGNLQ